MNQRILKFRAWNKTNKKWHEDWNNMFPWGTNPSDTTKIILDILPNHFEFNQFTGIKDKHGIEIYEGDILQVNWGIMENEYPLHELGSKFVMEFREYAWFPFDKYLPTPENIEVVGNKFENPELLNL